MFMSMEGGRILLALLCLVAVAAGCTSDLCKVTNVPDF